MVVGIIAVVLVLIFIAKHVEKKQLIAAHTQAHKELKPWAMKFGFNPDSSIYKSRIDKRYIELKDCIRKGEPTDFIGLSELEIAYFQITKLAELREIRMMALDSRRRNEFWD